MLRLTWRVVVVLLLIVVAVVGVGSRPAFAQDGTWLQHTDPSGITLSYPADWTLEAQDGLILIYDVLETSFVIVYSFPTAAGYTAAQCAQDVPGVFTEVLPKAVTLETQQIGTQPDQVEASLSYSVGTGMGTAGIACQVEAGNGLLFVAATPDTQYDAMWPVLMAILGTVNYDNGTQPGTQPGGQYDASITYQRWTDPLAGAFTLDVPAGWSVDGGLFTIADTWRPLVQMMSPDQMMMINIGRAEVNWFLQPTAELEAQGYPAGSVMYNDSGFMIMVQYYQTGAEAARALVEWALGESCDTLEFTAQRELEDISGLTDDQSMYVSAGEVAFVCTLQGVEMAGYYFVTTQAMNHPTLGELWLYDELVGYLALRERTNEAGAIMTHAYQSMALEQPWVDAQLATVQAGAGAGNGTGYTYTYDGGDAYTYEILADIAQMEHETSLIIIDNIDGVTEYEYV
ncbi:MAG: hypothetical protein K8S97_16270, partial [Anaerolineae bacterium]|nr:hypothetical protein [Anaerolineae bacterium]